MLIEQTLKIKWHSNNKKHFESLGYKFTKMKDIFNINVNQLQNNSTIKVKVQCDYCKNIIEKSYSSYLNGKSTGKDCCIKCFSKKKTEENKKPKKGNSLAEKFPYLIQEWSPKNNKTPFDYSYGSQKVIWWICSEGHEWKSEIGDRTGNSRKDCIICNNKRETMGERRIRQILTNKSIKFIKEYSFSNLLSERNFRLKFDFAIFDERDNLKMLIEFDGGQHFEVVKIYGEEHFKNTQYRDNLKNEYCKNNNIKLLRIPYWQINNIEEILNKALEVI